MSAQDLFSKNPLTIAIDDPSEITKDSLSPYFESFSDTVEWFDGLLMLDIYDQIKIIKYMKRNRLFPYNMYLRDWVTSSKIVQLEREMSKEQQDIE